MNFPVHTVDETYGACHPDEPLLTGDPRYVDLTEARGGENLVEETTLEIARTRAPHFYQQLISGHRGCGKSTELHRMKTLLEKKGFFVVYFDAEEALDLSEIKYQDVLVAIAREIERQLRKSGVELNAKLRQELDLWFADHILLEERRTDWETSLKTEFGVETKVPMLARVLAAIMGQIKAGSSRREEIRQKVELEIRVFIDRLNALIIAARQAVQAGSFHDLIVIVDGLEKMRLRAESDGQSNHSQLFVHNAEHLKAPQCHIIYTVPIFLAFNASLRDAFPNNPIILPMVNQNSEAGKIALHQLISKRVAIEDVFSEPDSVYRLIAMSGGSVRDLLRMVRSACGSGEQITAGDVNQAINRLSKELDRLLQQEDMEIFLEIAREKTIASYATAGKLLHLRLVHEYENGGRWADVHPALLEVSRVKKALEQPPRKSE